VKKFREAPFGRINAAAPFDGRKFFAMRGGGDFGGFGFVNARGDAFFGRDSQ
jgi:hypothetical protein